jgi:hypothetical protein
MDEPLLKKSTSHDPSLKTSTSSTYFSENLGSRDFGNIQSNPTFNVNMNINPQPKSTFITTSKTKKPMKPQDMLTLNWLEKWKKYNRFPWKLILHLLVTGLCTALVIVLFYFIFFAIVMFMFVFCFMLCFCSKI